MPKRANNTLLLATLACAFACAAPVAAAAGSSSPAGTSNGGISPSDPAFQPAPKAKIVHGIAIAPIGAPPQVVEAIDAANQIVRKPYVWGGGHASFNSRGYDCSGAVSYVLHGAGLLESPLDSSDLMHWGERGRGRWLTVYSNPGHAFMIIAGLRFDTGWRDRFAAAHGAAPGSGPRWAGPRPTRGYRARHVFGL